MAREIPESRRVGFDEDGSVSFEIKLSLVLYLDYAPGPNRARRVYDLYMRHFGQHIRVFQPTTIALPMEWTPANRSVFESHDLLNLKRGVAWGYGFEGGQPLNDHLFMFHGYKPASEAGKASFFRFEWPMDTDPESVRAFACELIDTVPFLSGTGGYICKPKLFDKDAEDAMFAICRRYWGIEAWALDTTVDHVLNGYKCVSWLTLIGDRLIEQAKDKPDLSLAEKHTHGTIFTARLRPDAIDRNMQEPFVGEAAIATALSCIQIRKHTSFGGTRWDDYNTMSWLLRFTTGTIS